MNNNLLIGLVVGAIVILGGIAFVAYSPSGPTATTTPATPSTAVANNTVTTATAGAPVAVTGSLVVASKSSAVVTGKVTPNGVPTSYWYEYGITNELGTRTSAQIVGSGYIAITTPGFISGLSANTTYYYRLSAQNAFGTVVGQVYSFTTNNNPPPQGVSPTARTDAASSVTRTGADLNGHVDPNGSDTLFWFEYGQTPDLGNITSFQSAGAGDVSQALSASLSGLKALTKYYFRVNAQNQYGTVNGTILSFTTSGPAASGAPTVSTSNPGNVATSSVTLRGRINPNGSPTTYWFEFGTDSLLGNILGSSTHTEITGNSSATVSVSADVQNLNPNVKYYYQLVASNSSGIVEGGIVIFTTKPSP